MKILSIWAWPNDSGPYLVDAMTQSGHDDNPEPINESLANTVKEIGFKSTSLVHFNLPDELYDGMTVGEGERHVKLIFATEGKETWISSSWDEFAIDENQAGFDRAIETLNKQSGITTLIVNYKFKEKSAKDLFAVRELN